MKPFYIYQYGDYQVFQTPNLWSTYQNYNYIIAKDKKAWVIDPGDYQPILNTIETNNLKIEKIFLTHHHHDHVGAVAQIKNRFNCEVIGFEEDKHRLPELDQTYSDGEQISLLGTKAEIIFTPGHTLGICALYLKKLKLVFSSDLLFSLGCGRVFEGSYEQMHASLEKIASLPDDTWVMSSHEYTIGNLDFALSQFPNDKKLLKIEEKLRKKVQNQIPTVPSLLSFEKEHNPFLRTQDPEIISTLKLESPEPWQVFAEIRKRKDHS